MPSPDKPAKNKLGKRFDWQPARTATPAEAAIGRLTAANGGQRPDEKEPVPSPVSVPPLPPAPSPLAKPQPPDAAKSEALPRPQAVGLVSPNQKDESERLHKLSAEVTDLRWWAFLSTAVCLMVLLSWLV